VTLPSDTQILITRQFNAPRHLVFRAWTTPELVSTEIFDAMPDAGAVDTLVLTEVDGRTTMSLLVDHESQANRDFHIQSGMEQGLQSALDLLERVALSLA
jgi:uncharacterized protein YndB with AHSA1/START domain